MDEKFKWKAMIDFLGNFVSLQKHVVFLTPEMQCPCIQPCYAGRVALSSLAERYACLMVCIPEGQLNTWPGGWLVMGNTWFSST